MFPGRNLACVLCLLVVVAPRAFAQTSSVEAACNSYALEGGKVEAAIITGLYAIEQKEYRIGDTAIGGTVAIGLTRHLAIEFGASRTGYRNDQYWKPEPPHNPYLATGTLLSFSGGGRYEFRNATARARPYLGAGIAASKFVNIQRGPKTLCFNDGSCIVMAPELFEGTKSTGFLDMGLKFMLRPQWGVGIGLKTYLLRGDESNPVKSVTGPSGSDLFWHEQLYISALYRWR